MVTGLAASIVDEDEREYVESSGSEEPLPRKISFNRRKTSSMNSFEARTINKLDDYEAYSDKNSEKHASARRLAEDDFVKIPSTKKSQRSFITSLTG